MTGFTPEQKSIILERDGHQCPMCGGRANEANHRANRGAGGYKAGNVLSNGCAICSLCNGRIESDPRYAELARDRGVKLSRYDDPRQEPYLHPMLKIKVWLADDGTYTLERPAS